MIHMIEERNLLICLRILSILLILSNAALPRSFPVKLPAPHELVVNLS